MLAVLTAADVEAKFNRTRRKPVFVLSTSALFWIRVWRVINTTPL